MKSIDTIEDMILSHIKNIENSIPYADKDTRAELYKAKSIALQSLVELKKADKMK